MKSVRSFVVLAALAAGCGSPGTVDFTTWGEEFIEEKIPADFEDWAQGDGWEVTFSKFLVTIGEIRAANGSDKVAVQLDTAKVFDMHAKGPHNIESYANLPPEELTNVSYAIAPASNAVAGNATAADLELLKTNGYSVYIEGTAKQGAVTKTFKWGFNTNTQYNDCEHPDLGKGITVPSGGAVEAQLTIHGDHLFYDDLQSPDAKMRFKAIADADKDSNGEVTMDELAAVDLTTLPVDQYGTGDAGSVRNLKDFVTALARTIGHYRGEGECSPKAR